MKTILIGLLILLIIFNIQTLLFASKFNEEDMMIPLAGDNNFNVTIPVQLPINMDEFGIVTTSNTANIVNNSTAPIEIINAQVNTLNGWEIYDYNGDYTSRNVGSKELGLIINGDTVSLGGGLSLTPSHWKPINVNSNFNINYDAKIPAQIDSIINQQVANVVFTIDWVGGIAPNLYKVTFPNPIQSILPEEETPTTEDQDIITDYMVTEDDEEEIEAEEEEEEEEEDIIIIEIKEDIEDHDEQQIP